MDMRADARNTSQTNAFTVWTNVANRLSEQMTRDYWAHAEALGRYVDDIARARTLATYDEAHSTYRQRVLTLFEQSARGYASLWQPQPRPSVGLDEGRSNNTTTASADGADVVQDAPRSTVRDAATGAEVTGGAAPAVTGASPGLTESARAMAAADALLDSVRAKAAAAAEVSATPSKKRRAHKAAPKVEQDTVAASVQKPRKRPRRPPKVAPPVG